MLLALQGNPLSKDVMNLYSEPNGTQKLLSYMLDNLQGIYIIIVIATQSIVVSFELIFE